MDVVILLKDYIIYSFYKNVFVHCDFIFCKHIITFNNLLHISMYFLLIMLTLQNCKMVYCLLYMYISRYLYKERCTNATALLDFGSLRSHVVLFNLLHFFIHEISYLFTSDSFATSFYSIGWTAVILFGMTHKLKYVFTWQ